MGSQRVRVAYCACVFTRDVDASGGVSNVVMETVCARHAKTAGQRAQHDAIEAEHEVANNAIAAALASGVAGVAALPVAGLVSVDGNGVIVLGPTGLTAARISQLQTKLDTAVGAGKARVI